MGTPFFLVEFTLVIFNVWGSMIHLDFETYSELDVRNVGAFRYAQHLSTEVLIMSYAFDDEEPSTWVQGKPFPRSLVQRIQAGDKVGAHNAQFEYVVWNYVLRLRQMKALALPKLRGTQLTCTAARAAVCSLPRSLEKAGAALGLSIVKDKRGGQLIKIFCKPRKPSKNDPSTRVLPAHKPTEFNEFIEYCEQDVRAEQALDRALPELPLYERIAYNFDLRINQRGIPIDIPMVKHATVIVHELEHRARLRVKELTGGIAPTQVAKVKEFLSEEHDLDLDNLQAGTIKDLISKGGLDPVALEILQLRMESSKVSTKKLQSMARVTDEDHRARGTLLYAGAHTLRWSGKLIQPHNFIRGMDDPKQNFDHMNIVFRLLHQEDADIYEYMYPAPLTAIAMCMRGFICAGEGKKFMVVDYAQIEARVLAWLAQEEHVLDAYRAGEDVYKLMAAFLWGIQKEQVSKEQRRIAKNLVLGCGFGLGGKKFIEYCAKAGVTIDMEMSQRAVKAYRERHPNIVSYWGDVERCAIAAVENPGKTIRLRNVSFVVDTSSAAPYLKILLPSGRPLYYPYPKVHVEEQYGRPKKVLTFMTEYFGAWIRNSTYGGRLVENIVQAVARDIMLEGGLQAEKEGYVPVLTVHDEWICEVLQNFGDIHELCKIVCRIGAWTEGCPITAEGFETKRYRKG